MEVISGIEGQLNIITRPELRLPPRGAIKFCHVEILLSPFAEDDFLLEGVIGANLAMPRDFRIFIPKNRLRSFVAKVIRGEDDYQMIMNEFFSDYFRGEF
jgi:hypothetical protein